MAKKAQVSSKSKAKATANVAATAKVAPKKASPTKASPTKAKAVEAKSVPSKASKATASMKPPQKLAAKEVAKPAAKAKVEAATAEKPVSKKMASAETPKALSKAPEKSAQTTESSEKIKIDKNMTEEQVKWAEMYNKYKDVQALVYDMRSTFKASSAIQHKVLGWGWIVSNENDRLEVLFRDGKRMLISNYRG